jgi:hypothetical protein
MTSGLSGPPIVQQAAPDSVGNDYLVVGTVGRVDWLQCTADAMTPQEMINLLHDFKDVVEFRLEGGWMPRVP